jgi:gamma-glutamyltranspeptidase / glutathione hydrolase
VLSAYGMGTGVVASASNPESGTLRAGADVRRGRYIFGW